MPSNIPITILLYFFLNQIILSLASRNSPVLYQPPKDIAVNCGFSCGSSGKSTGLDGGRWIKHMCSKNTPLLHSCNGKLICLKATKPQLSSGPVRGTFRVTPGQKFMRKFVYASGGNAIATVFVILLTVLNVSVYKLRVWGEKIGKKIISPLPPEGLCRLFSLTEILSMTNNFDDELVIGCGGFGNVYKGIIGDGTTAVAIKRLNSKSKQGPNEFWTEIKMLSNLRHTHLVSLIGYCDELPEMILVYEYMEHGTLADHLYKSHTSGNGAICHLSWEQRIKICIGAARGLDYLHTGTGNGIIHRDVKTTNILLDKDRVAKISDFGLCKEGPTSHSHPHVSCTDVRGTFGYLDPEYFFTQRLTKKSDVYAFGVVLLEVLCGRPALDIKLEEEQRSLALWAQQCIEEEKLEKLIDPSLRDQTSPECLKTFIEVASKCLHKHSSERPTMAAVMVSLESMLFSLERHKISSMEENVNVNGDSNKDDILLEGTVASPSTPVQLNDNTQRQKRSKKNFFRRGIAFLARGTDIWSLEVPDVKIRITATNESIGKDHIKISSNRRISALSDTDMGYLDGQILPTPNLRIFSFSELRKATRNFNLDTLLGEERFGKVYRGMLDEKVKSKNGKGFIVAVKRLDFHARHRFQYWQSAVGFLGSHSNLVKLLGHCKKHEDLFLVYEYMPKGSLASHLFGRRSAVHPLPWNIRLKILIGAARGLAFLHTLKRPVICREFSASNILLDGSFNSKITDFGFEEVDSPENCVYVPINIQGRKYLYGQYVAPEFVATGLFDVKSVVYSFGAVLLEMLSGLRADNLVDRVEHLVDTRSLTSVMDSRLEGKYPPEAALQIAHLAKQCLGAYPKIRPSMKEVVETLESVSQGHTEELTEQQLEESGSPLAQPN